MHPDREWMDHANCVGLTKGEVRMLDRAFFPVGTGGIAGSVDWGQARLLCNNCPVRPECLDYALTTGSEYGMYGGLTPDERAAYQAQRNKGNTR